MLCVHVFLRNLPLASAACIHTLPGHPPCLTFRSAAQKTLHLASELPIIPSPLPAALALRDVSLLSLEDCAYSHSMPKNPCRRLFSAGHHLLVVSLGSLA